MNRPLYYAVGIENKGKDPIWVDSFRIAAGRNAIVSSIGEIPPGKAGTIAPFYSKPYSDISINWHTYTSTTSLNGAAQVRLNLPGEFTRKGGQCITFSIFPESQRVDVAYTIINPKTGHIDIVQQSSIDQK